MTHRTEILARHTTPDGALTLVVQRDEEFGKPPVLSLGFEGFGWHVHPDGFRAEGRGDEQVLLDILDDVISDRMIIMFTGFDDGLMEPSILDSIEFEVDFYQPGDRFAFRFWSGEVVTLDDLMDGKVDFKPFGQIGTAG